jgi:hypothetical protein
MAYIVEFIKVGREKKSWRAFLKTLQTEDIRAEIADKADVLSRNIDVDFNQRGDRLGFIYAGFHKIGKFKYQEFFADLGSK